MIITKIAQTEPISESSSTLVDIQAFGGMNAGICYMPDTLESLMNQSDEVKLKRMKGCLKSTHHSTIGHTFVEITLEGVPKIVAMLLNSLGFYNTSEKSARYTVMNDIPENQKVVYEKWRNLLSIEIEKMYPEIEEAHRKKLALENARYMLSVFTPTVMSYTTDVRQFNYIIDWCRRFRADFKGSDFYERIATSLEELANLLEESLYIENLRDVKGRKFEFFSTDMVDYEETEEHYGKSYTTKYLGSFAQLAQAIRSRTLDYNMYFDGEADAFYIPTIIENDEDLVAEWLTDINSLAVEYPQGTLVSILERGTLENFLLKTTERECGCAQLEIQKQCEKTHVIYESIGKFTTKDKALLKKYVSKTKCGMGFPCNRPCIWGGAKSRLRLI